MAVARYFNADTYDGETFPPVGLADIDEAEWDALPAHVQATVDSLPYFRKTKPGPARAAKADEPEKETR
jgi:hypothetical protein